MLIVVELLSVEVDSDVSTSLIPANVVVVVVTLPPTLVLIGMVDVPELVS